MFSLFSKKEEHFTITLGVGYTDLVNKNSEIKLKKLNDGITQLTNLIKKNIKISNISETDLLKYAFDKKAITIKCIMASDDILEAAKRQCRLVPQNAFNPCYEVTIHSAMLAKNMYDVYKNIDWTTYNELIKIYLRIYEINFTIDIKKLNSDNTGGQRRNYRYIRNYKNIKSKKPFNYAKHTKSRRIRRQRSSRFYK
jgi:hypothetical protein